MTDRRLEDELACARVAYRHALRHCFDKTPEWHGKILSPKPGTPWEKYIPMSFSLTLIDLADGMHNLREFWEVET